MVRYNCFAITHHERFLCASKQFTLIFVVSLFSIINVDAKTGTSYTLKADRFTSSRAENNAVISAFGDQIVGQRVDNFNVMFQYNIPTDMVTVDTTGTGTVTTFDSMACIATGTDPTGSAQVETNLALRYLTGHEGYVYFTGIFTDGVAGSQQLIGLFDDVDGFAIGYNSTEFSVLHRRNSVDTFISQSSFNLDPLNGNGFSEISLDTTKLNVFKISYGWLGGAPILFEVMREDGVWFPFHKIQQPNSVAGPSTINPVLPLRAQVIKTSGATDIVLKTPSWSGGTVGSNIASFSRDHQQNVANVSVGAGDSDPVLSIRNKTTFQGITNRVVVQLIFGGFSARPQSGGQLTRFTLYKNATLTAPIWSDKDTATSVIEVDTSATAFSGGTDVFVVPLADRGQENLFFASNRVNILLLPGETLTVVAAPEVATTVDVSLFWNERI